MGTLFSGLGCLQLGAQTISDAQILYYDGDGAHCDVFESVCKKIGYVCLVLASGLFTLLA